jgi:hypothetical protein
MKRAPHVVRQHPEQQVSLVLGLCIEECHGFSYSLIDRLIKSQYIG